jgi:hypothetical protein
MGYTFCKTSKIPRMEQVFGIYRGTRRFLHFLLIISNLGGKKLGLWWSNKWKFNRHVIIPDQLWFWHPEIMQLSKENVLKIIVFQDMTLCSLVGIYQYFGWDCCLRLQHIGGRCLGEKNGNDIGKGEQEMGPRVIQSEQCNKKSCGKC